MSSIDSKAVFHLRVKELNLDDLWDTFERLGWSTHGNFGFASTYLPGSGMDDSLFLTTIYDKMFDSRDDHRESALRRLHFESYTMS